MVLLPARNAAADLPDWFASVEPFADAVIALDDGSTDDTAALLDAHPLVKVLLTNPRRDTYEGWDDSGNRNRLLAAAHDLTPDWILSLDADERIPADDAHALRHFLDTDALPGLAYGLQCFRMWGERCEPARCGCTACSPPPPDSASPPTSSTSTPSPPPSTAPATCARRCGSSTWAPTASSAGRPGWPSTSRPIPTACSPPVTEGSTTPRRSWCPGWSNAIPTSP